MKTQNKKNENASPSANPKTLRLHFYYSLLGGLCPLIPVPFVDEWALYRVHRRLIRKTAAENGARLTEGQIRLLVDDFDQSGGCAFLPFNIVWKLFFYPFKRLYRKILFFLAVKDSVNTTSRLFHHAALIEYAILTQRIRAAGEEDGNLRLVNRAIKDTCERIDTRPLNQLLKRSIGGSTAMLKTAGKSFGRLIRQVKRRVKTDEAVPDDFETNDEWMGRTLDDLSDGLGRNQGYLTELRETFEARIKEAGDGRTA